MPERARRRGFLAPLLGLLAVLVLGVGGTYAALSWLVPMRYANACTVTLPDVDATTVDADQADNAALITAISVRRELPARAASIAIATAIQESKLRNIDYGDRDSLGLFQQRPSQGWGAPEQVMDPVYATHTFYDALLEVSGYEGLPVTEAAQRVQRSAFPNAYADHEPEGRALASALTGHSPASLTCRLPMPDDGGADVSAVVARLERDFGTVATTVTDGVVEVDAASLPGAADAAAVERLSWALAQWAVATASTTDVARVEVAGHAWRRADGNDAAWTAAEPGDDAGPGPGIVRIS